WGGGGSTVIGTQGLTLANQAPSCSSVPFLCLNNSLILAFFAGVLLTLLLMAFVFLIIKSCRRCKCFLSKGTTFPLWWRTEGHPSPQVLDPHSDSPAKLSSIPKESLTYASMTFRPSEEKSSHLTENCSADSDPVVYAHVKVTKSHLPVQ
uniref:Uncharacterized protein n=1 Tax=Castor canadensis TaxID=51338 RepID=A0A8C0WWJ4_CASCN